MKTKLILLMAGMLIFAGAGLGTAENPPRESNTTQRGIFKVENLTCGACFSRINQELNGMDGFAGMGANLLRKLVAVDFNAPLTAEKIGTAISSLGYPATLESTEYPGEKETFAYMQSQRRGYGGGGCCGGAPQPGTCAGGGSGCAQAGASGSNPSKDI